MSTFDESLHPRGQAANAGQFVAKTNDAPTGGLEAARMTATDHYAQRFYASVGELCRAEERVQDAQLLAYAAEMKGIAPHVTQVIASWSDESEHLSVDEWLNADGDEVDLDEWPDMTLDTFDDFESARSRFLSTGDTDAPRFVVPLPSVPDLTPSVLAKTPAQIDLESDRRAVPADVLRRAQDALNSGAASQSAGELYSILREIVGSAG